MISSSSIKIAMFRYSGTYVGTAAVMTDHIGKQECDLKTDHIQQNKIKVF